VVDVLRFVIYTGEYLRSSRDLVIKCLFLA
jgi:hypothetical protein